MLIPWNIWCRYYWTGWSGGLIQRFSAKCFENLTKQQVWIFFSSSSYFPFYTRHQKMMIALFTWGIVSHLHWSHSTGIRCLHLVPILIDMYEWPKKLEQLTAWWYNQIGILITHQWTCFLSPSCSIRLTIFDAVKRLIANSEKEFQRIMEENRQKQSVNAGRWSVSFFATFYDLGSLAQIHCGG